MNSAAPSVAYHLPLTHEIRTVTSFPELLKLAGTRAAVGKAWGVALRTYDRRKKDPGSLTVQEVQKLAVMLAIGEQELFALVSANARAAGKKASGGEGKKPSK